MSRYSSMVALAEGLGVLRDRSGRAVRALGARPVAADALDPDAVGRAVAEAENSLAATAARM